MMSNMSTTTILPALAVAACILISSSSHAFSQPSTRMHTGTYYSHTTRPSTWSSLTAVEPSKESMEHDIQEMRTQAKERLRALSEQMEDWKEDQPQSDNNSDNDSADETKKPANVKQDEQVETEAKAQPQVLAAAVSKKKRIAPYVSQRQRKQKKLDLLDDTRWRIVFNIGREPATWMPATWGKSGDRLRFSVVVDLTDEPLYERDEFFQGVAGAKILQVVEAWVAPTGVGAASRGRRPIAVQQTGGYKVLAGKGPAGTDIVRIYVELTEQVRAKAGSDVSCPVGRVYGTCGYFAMHDYSQDILGEGDQPHPKEILAKQHLALQRQYEQIKEELDSDERLFSMDQLQKMKQLMDLRVQLGNVGKELQRAREWEPEKSQLRKSRDGRVGLTREGGVCCKVQKGITVEYHILGKMELASIKHEDEEDDDDDDEHEDGVVPSSSHPKHEHDEDLDRLNKLRP
jgi:hypothetical protein